MFETERPARHKMKKIKYFNIDKLGNK